MALFNQSYNLNFCQSLKLPGAVSRIEKVSEAKPVWREAQVIWLAIAANKGFKAALTDEQERIHHFCEWGAMPCGEQRGLGLFH